MISTLYLHEVLDLKTRPKVISDMFHQILQSGLEFEAIAFTGYSGALIGPSLADLLRKDLLIVRKKTDKRHSQCEVEGNCFVTKYIFVDDFVDSGDTVRRIMVSIRSRIPEAQCVGMFFYDGEHNSPNLIGLCDFYQCPMYTPKGLNTPCKYENVPAPAVLLNSIQKTTAPLLPVLRAAGPYLYNQPTGDVLGTPG